MEHERGKKSVGGHGIANNRTNIMSDSAQIVRSRGRSQSVSPILWLKLHRNSRPRFASDFPWGLPGFAGSPLHSYIFIAMTLRSVAAHSASPNPAQANLQVCSPFRRLKQSLSVGITAILLSSLVHPAWAGDPFRINNPKDIDHNTEEAFKALFQQGDYPVAKEALQTASETEPLAHTLRAVMMLLEEGLEENPAALKKYGDRTRETAQQLKETDPLRGHLYIAMAYVLEGAYQYSQAGSVKGSSIALQNLQIVLAHLKAAEQIDANDPELNLLKGYVDLLIAVNLPFSNPNNAIQKLENNAAPAYISQRGAALGYRDLNQLDRAIAAVDKAIAAAPSNPELFYLKAQILAKQKKIQESLGFFEKALAQKDQLPVALVEKITAEKNKVARPLN